MSLTDRQKETLKKVTEELSAMSNEKFFVELEKHKDGDIVRILIEVKAIL